MLFASFESFHVVNVMMIHYASLLSREQERTGEERRGEERRGEERRGEERRGEESRGGADEKK